MNLIPFDFLQQWLDRNEERLRKLKIRTELEKSKVWSPENYAALVNLYSNLRIGQMILWNTGALETEVLNTTTAETTFIDSSIITSEAAFTELAQKVISEMI